MSHPPELPPRWRTALPMLSTGPAGCLIGCITYAVGLAALPPRWTGWGLLAGLVCAAVGAVVLHRSFPPPDISSEQRLERALVGTQSAQRARPLVLLAFFVLVAALQVGGRNAVWLPLGALIAGAFAEFFVEILRVRRFRGPVVWDDMARTRAVYRRLGGSRGLRRGRTRRP